MTVRKVNAFLKLVIGRKKTLCYGLIRYGTLNSNLLLYFVKITTENTERITKRYEERKRKKTDVIDPKKEKKNC